ncbi:MAG: imidazole glycerol phosphate synthase subunit HisH [Ruminococcus sp.]|nr:imidazole glycerol phosphate synthase subunit HisH [Ruminococcus sp.]
MIAIIDYGTGNIFSVKNALDFLEIPGKLTADPEEIQKADALILPGVGAFPSAMEMLRESGLVEVIQEQSQKKPFLGICLGMQLLFEKGYEFEACDGLGLIPGSVEKIIAPGLVIPHMGWNALKMQNPCPILAGLPEESYVYFVHSYQAVVPDKYLSAYVEYGTAKIPAMVTDGKTVFGAQFHPEKSGEVGLQILRNFAAQCERKDSI